MPIDKYFNGEGDKVMSDMKSRYGAKGGERAFYATAEKRGMKPGGKKKASPKKRA